MRRPDDRAPDTAVRLERLSAGVHLDDLRVPGSSRAALHALAGSRARGRFVLFSGPRSTGKTLAAEALARALDLDAFRIDLTAVVSQYIGETEKNLGRVFGAAGAGGALLFFDEADALFGRRTEVRDAHDRYANQEIAYFLQRVEDYEGMVILASNRPTTLAPAVTTRLTATIGIPRLMA
jgi:SpoVK/Ycf46/Vps4 family AAA+-type ATPase